MKTAGDTAGNQHVAGIHGLGVDQPGQRGAVGAQQERGLDQVALRLLDGECGEFTVIQSAFRHHAVDRAAELCL